MVFHDRVDAGRQLAAKLAHRKGKEAVVFALPRGGVPAAGPIAAMLPAPLDLVLARKIGAPFRPELARLTAAGAEKMIAEYLQCFRSEHMDDPLFPFTKEASRKVLLQAVDDGSNAITKEFAMKVLDSSVDALPTAEGVEENSSFGGYED